MKVQYVSILMILSSIIISGCEGNNSGNNASQNGASQNNAAQTNTQTESLTFSNLQGTWSSDSNANTHLVFKRNGDFKMFKYSDALKCQLLLDANSINNNGTVNLNNLDKNISSSFIENGVLTLTYAKDPKNILIRRWYKTNKTEADFKPICNMVDKSGHFATMDDIKGTWERTVYQNSVPNKLYMNINESILNVYATSPTLDCAVKANPVRIFEIGFGVFKSNMNGVFTITNGDNSITIKPENNQSDKVKDATIVNEVWNKSVQKVDQFKICQLPAK